MAAVLDNSRVQRVLRRYEKKYDNSIAVLLSSKKGLKPQAAFDLMEVSPLIFSQIESILQVSLKTLRNYKQHDQHLSAAMSEKVLSILALYKKGVSIFGSIGDFNKWMAAPAYGLGMQRPTELLDTMTGILLIGEELTRIEYGDLS